MKNLLFILCMLIAFQLHSQNDLKNIEIMVLGVAQDGGHPQAGCAKSCCTQFEQSHYVTSLAIIDRSSNKVWLVDCTPDFREQWKMIQDHSGYQAELEGIFLTHAHIGHYLGLAQLGREVMGINEIDVYAMPRMTEFLETNGPWDQLVTLKNIHINSIENQKPQVLNSQISLVPFLVPHRDEYSETVGYSIRINSQNVLFIPDIDKWTKWKTDLKDAVKRCDIAFIDGTFYDSDELPGRDISEIPHPLVTESMSYLESLSDEDREKVHFIHLNHTNVLLKEGEAKQMLEQKGFNLATQGQLIQF